MTATCPHRSPIPDHQRACDLCGMRGTIFDVYNCAVYGDCSLTRFHSQVRSCLVCPDNPANDEPVSPIIQPIVGITTAPRRDGILPQCLRSLRRAGAADIRIFAEPESDLAGCDGTTIVQRATRFGAWHNWLAMCRELIDSGADLILTVQDDVIFSRSALSHPLLIDLPPRRGFVSLYTPSHYQTKFAIVKNNRTIAIRHDRFEAERLATRRRAAVQRREVPDGINAVTTRSLWGACALMFSRATLQEIIDHPIAQNWRGAGSARKRRRFAYEIANVDTAIGLICNALKVPMLFVSPSLAQHAAEHSTLGHGGLGGRRQSARVADDIRYVSHRPAYSCRRCP